MEAALVIPLFLMFVSIFFSLFSSQIWQLRLQKELEGVGEDLAVWSYALDFADDYSTQDLLSWTEGSHLHEALQGNRESLEALLDPQADLMEQVKLFFLERGSALLWQPLIKAWLVNRVGAERIDRSLITGGAGGLSLSGSTLHNRKLDLVLSYRFHTLLGEPFGISFPVVLRSCHRLWIGTAVEKPEGEEETEEEPGEEIVYVTEGGEAYHRSQSCRVFNINPLLCERSGIGKLRSRDGSKYYPCERCVLNRPAQVHVWYTDFGVRFHNESDCPSLKRCVIQLAISEAEQRKYRPCGFCGKKHE